ncbi:MAG: precorrin-6A reductase [Pyramidobacter sp.]|jgi:precorrin-6A/cobalt-precorrin-6A reductase
MIVLFGGTTEARWLLERGLPALCCVATDYGAKLLQGLKDVEVRVGRLDEAAMEALFRRENPDVVVDATHPYATEVTKNIKTACKKSGVAYLRVIRRKTPLFGDVTVVGSPREAAELLNRSDEKVLLTVGSKELPAFASVANGRQRLYARVLPTSDVIAQCESLGYDAGHLIAMQGPFTAEMNRQMLAATGASVVVTKDGGDAGGMKEKLSAAQEAGARVIVIGRPDEAGLTPEEALLKLRRDLKLPAPPPFPLFLPLEKKTAVIVGAGAVALRRAKTLARCGASLRVVAPKFCTGWDVDAVKIERDYRDGDLEGACLAVAATDSRHVNHAVAEEAKRRRIPVSVADNAAEGTFYFPALIGDSWAAVAVTTAGLAPDLTHRLANRVRRLWPQILEEELDHRKERPNGQ